MIPLQLLIVFLWLPSSCCQQYYDRTQCSSDAETPTTSYTCASAGKSCRTFIVYRANNRFSTVSAVANLFQADSDALISVNPNVSSPSRILELGHEILVPVTCSCSGGSFYRSFFTYTASQNISISEIACAVYEGLVKSAALAAENLIAGGDEVVPAGSAIRVPVKCACLDDFSEKNEVKYLITYPFIKGDNTNKVGKKFDVAVEQILKFNRMAPFAATVFPNTTILVPVRNEPLINFSIPDSDPPTPQFLPTKPVEKLGQNWSKLKKMCVAGSVIGTFLIVSLIISCVLYMKALKKFEDQRILALNSCSTPISSLLSTNSCLSPDLLIGIKYSLRSYTFEELKIATKNFSNDVRMSSSLYRGDDVMIKEMMRLEGTKVMIDVHSKINHVNIVKLRGVCYGDEGCPCSYLVFELPYNGSLRDCLSRSSAALHWHRRTQIAFDIATGLHYLHYSVIPGYTHLSLSSTNIFLNSAWRAKILVCGESGTSPPGGWIAPEHDARGTGSERVEVFGFGVLMLELIAGREGLDERGVRETMSFLGGAGVNEGGCFDQLRMFVDPCLKDDYPLAEALCLAVLAGSCVEDDPKHRPSMEDVLKILARMV